MARRRSEAERRAAQARFDAMVEADTRRLRAEVERRRLEVEAMPEADRAALTAEAVRVFGRRDA